jgi:hypothetical protein
LGIIRQLPQLLQNPILVRTFQIIYKTKSKIEAGITAAVRGWTNGRSLSFVLELFASRQKVRSNIY